MKNLNITKRVNGSVIILDLKGNIRLGESSAQLHEMLRSLVEQNERRIILNMADVSGIDSSGLGELVGGYATLCRIGGELKLCNLSDKAHELMTMTKLLTVFEIYDNENLAVDSFSQASEKTSMNQTAPTNGDLDQAAANL